MNSTFALAKTERYTRNHIDNSQISQDQCYPYTQVPATTNQKLYFSGHIARSIFLIINTVQEKDVSM